MFYNVKKDIFLKLQEINNQKATYYELPSPKYLTCYNYIPLIAYLRTVL